MRVLVTGAGGLLGGRLAELLHRRGLETIGVIREIPGPAGPRLVSRDLLADGAVERLLDEVRPDAVVHAAVLGRADLCERDPARAAATNTALPRSVARACRERAVRLVSLSTDLVFSGRQASSSEADLAEPVNVYGRTKRAGEQALLDEFPEAVVCRVALVLGRGHGPRGTASEAVAWSLRAGRPARLFADEHRTPLDPESVADAIERLLATPASGVFHLAGPERLSRYELGERVARALRLDTALLQRSLQRDYPGPDPRPADVSLSSARARRELEWQPRPIDVAIREGRDAPA